MLERQADGQRAWWKLPRGNWRVLGVLRVWSLGNNRLEGPNKRGLCAGKGHAARLERWRPGAWWKLPRGMCRQRAGCNPGAAKADGQRAWWKLPRGNWRVLGVLRVLSVWSLVTAGLNASMKDGYDKAGSTPPVVPGAAPALAKARVGGYIYMHPYNLKCIFTCKCVNYGWIIDTWQHLVKYQW